MTIHAFTVQGVALGPACATDPVLAPRRHPIDDPPPSTPHPDAPVDEPKKPEPPVEEPEDEDEEPPDT
ncbi:MAG TPA: hypothetical protein VGI14_02675 [Casimicrobiaceae bacterium]|jgi:hypothetical protein